MKKPQSKETFRKVQDARPSGGLSMLGRDSLHPYSGEIFWEVRDAATGELQSSGRRKNVVTLDASILVARLMKSPPVANISEPKYGVFALAVGTGDVGWDPMNPPVATNTQRSLYNELARKQLASSSFITAAGTVSGIPTHVVAFSTTFTEAEAVGPLVEMGLLGGDVDSNMAVRNPILPPNGIYDPTVDVVGKDCLVNYLTFPVINKPPTSTLSWTWRLTFSILLWIMTGNVWSWSGQSTATPTSSPDVAMSVSLSIQCHTGGTSTVPKQSA